MALYDLGRDSYWVARAEDLLFLEVSVDRQAGTVTLYLPTQSVMEIAPDAGASPDTPWQLPLTGGGLSAIGGQAREDSITFAPTGGLDLERLLEKLQREPARKAFLRMPALLHLETVAESHWDLHPNPRTGGGGWTAIWQADLLDTGGPRVWHVREASPAPPLFNTRPASDFAQFADAFFRTRTSLTMMGANGWIDDRFFVQVQAHEGAPSMRFACRSGREVASHEVVPGVLSSGHRAQLDVERVRVITHGTFDGMGLTGATEADPYLNGKTYTFANLVETATLTVLDEVVAVGVDSPFRTVVYAGPRTVRVDRPEGPAFWVSQGGRRLPCALVGIDWEGRECGFTTPLVFRAATAGHQAMVDVFRSGGAEAGTVHLGGAPVALADRRGHPDIGPEAVTLPVHRMLLDLVADAAGPVLVPRQAEVALDAVQRLTGQAGLALCDLKHRVDGAGNFLTVAGDGLGVRFPAPAVGGLATPDTVLGAVNALRGAVPTLDPRQAFAQARLLGTDLVDLLADELGDLPKMDSLRLPDRIQTTYEWQPALQVGGRGIVRFEQGSSLMLQAVLEQPLDPQQPLNQQPTAPTVDVTGRLAKATICLLDMIAVRFETLTFRTPPNSAPVVTATGVTVTLSKDLSFIQDLAEQVRDFADGSPVTVDATGVQAGYDVALPDIGFGVFSLTNVSLGAHVRIPFTSEPASVRFNFGTRAAPFTLGVGIFGGGGYVALEASSKELTVEASLEFGGDFAIAVVAAEGHVYAMGGIAFVRGDNTVRLEGFLRCGGQLTVLDVVGVSVDFQVALGYVDDSRGARVYGSAIVTVGVEVLVFHESVSFTVEKSFAVGEHASPAELPVDEPSFDAFCDAFA